MNSSDTRHRANDMPAADLRLPFEALPKVAPPGDCPCPDETEIIDYASSPRRHPDRKHIAEHVRLCTDCALITADIAKVRQEAREEIRRAGALKYLRGEHPNKRRFEDHRERCGPCAAWLAVLRPFSAPALGSPKVAWGVATVCAVAFVGSVVTRPDEPTHVEMGSGVDVPAGGKLDARSVAEYLEQFSRKDLTDNQVKELHRLTNQLESRLYGDEELSQDPAFLMTVAALFHRRYELTRDQRALDTYTELSEQAQELLRLPEAK